MIELVAALLLAVGGGGTVEMQQDGVRVKVWVESSVYNWEVTNVAAPPIDSIELKIDREHTYNASIPPGWSHEFAEDHFRSWTERSARAIRPGRTERFSVQVGVQGTVLGDAILHLGTTDGGETMTIAPVWGPVDLPRSQVALIAGLLAVIAVVHFWLVRGRHAEGQGN